MRILTLHAPAPGADGRRSEHLHGRLEPMSCHTGIFRAQYIMASVANLHSRSPLSFRFSMHKLYACLGTYLLHLLQC